MSLREEHEQGLSLFIESTHRPRFRESLTNERMRGKTTALLLGALWEGDPMIWLVFASSLGRAVWRHTDAKSLVPVPSKDPADFR